VDEKIEWDGLGQIKSFVDELRELVAFPIQWDHEFLGGERIGRLGSENDRV
jgi:hypothetical protein